MKPKIFTKILMICFCVIMALSFVSACISVDYDDDTLRDRLAELEYRLNNVEATLSEIEYDLLGIENEVAYTEQSILEHLTAEILLQRKAIENIEQDIAAIERAIEEIAAIGTDTRNITECTEKLTLALGQLNGRLTGFRNDLLVLERQLADARILLEYIKERDCLPTDFGYRTGDFWLSHAPGIFGAEFDLEIRHAANNAVIYYTLDGSDPIPGANRYMQPRGGGVAPIRMTGRIGEDRRIPIRDKSVSHWQRYSQFAHLTNLSWGLGEGDGGGQPPHNAQLRKGMAIRLRAFVDGAPAGQTITATYIVWEGFDEIFGSLPIISVTARDADFRAVHADTRVTLDENVRRNFYYEFFENDVEGGIHQRVFHMYGSTSLGGMGSRNNPQRTLNVHLARGGEGLSGHVTHPVFAGLYDLTRFRLWNGGNSFWWCHMRDPFAQQAAMRLGLNVVGADYRLAIKFINGEFWGFTTIREHTSNNFFTHSRMGITPRNNAALLNTTWHPYYWSTPQPHSIPRFFTEIEESAGGAAAVRYEELNNFVFNNNLTLDANRARLFDEFFCEDNFIDYIIVQTFFMNGDWPPNNVRAARAAIPDPNSSNPNMDGRWRFILHDLDRIMPNAPIDNATMFGGEGTGIWPNGWSWRMPVYDNTFTRLRNYANRYTNRNQNRLVWTRVFSVLNNRTFALRVRARGLYIIDNHLTREFLEELFEEMRSERRPLLEEHYSRFTMNNHRTVEASLDQWYRHMAVIEEFVANRHAHYRQHLLAL